MAELHILSDLPHIVDAGIRRPVDLNHIDGVSRVISWQLEQLLQGVPVGPLAVQRLGENSSDRRFADASGAREDIRMGDAFGRDRVHQAFARREADRSRRRMCPDGIFGLRPGNPESLHSNCVDMSAQYRVITRRIQEDFLLNSSLIVSRKGTEVPGPGDPAAHRTTYLPLLPSGPGGVHRVLLHRAQPLLNSSECRVIES